MIPTDAEIANAVETAVRNAGIERAFRDLKLPPTRTLFWAGQISELRSTQTRPYGLLSTPPCQRPRLCYT